MKKLIVAFGILLLLHGCAKKPAAVPKPEAYPRVDRYEPVYTRNLDGFAINDSVIVEPGDSAGWYTLRYPRYGNAAVYLTVANVSPDRLPEVLDMRIERIELNAGSGKKSSRRITDAEGRQNGYMLLTAGGTVTPLQFLWFNPDGKLVSGALYVPEGASAPADSTMETVFTVSADIQHALEHMR